MVFLINILCLILGIILIFKPKILLKYFTNKDIMILKQNNKDELNKVNKKLFNFWGAYLILISFLTLIGVTKNPVILVLLYFIVPFIIAIAIEKKINNKNKD